MSISKVKLFLWGLLGFAAVVASSQIPLNGANAFTQYDDGLFAPLEDLSRLSDLHFTTFGHPAFPGHSIRMKRSESAFCDKTVKSYTGYIDKYNHHIFFYFFESRNDPDKDDVIFWTNGGPGGSSSLGLFMELGPCRIVDEKQTKYHPESWNSNANIFFVDQPVGVGYSYADYGDPVGTTEEAAKDIAAFVAIFFQNFSKFQGRPFHMAGESYGGRYIPLFASAVYDQNPRLIEAGLAPINLTSIMIGNGLTNILQMFDGRYKMACTVGASTQVVDIQTCVGMKQALSRCERWLQASCYDTFDDVACQAAFSFCSSAIDGPYEITGKNPYDVTKDCIGELEDTICYPIVSDIVRYLSRKDVRDQLGVDSSLPSNFSAIGWDVNRAFTLHHDELRPSYLYVAQLLERGVKALIYVGANDWICNWIGNEAWTLDLEWSQQEEFNGQVLRDWKVDGKVAGQTRSAGGLTFATVLGAGHMVPYDKPKEALELLTRWLSKTEL
ncbi:serine carboxypeptidase [Crepidotus variabilis]|uniref:Carboxypeptidase n=1 Tax=Crepidotus variabilis TaxID=179855 RepID=A0A9P6EDM1_9AGAR|nr:serine carboxypeptidase [Crepidotus variabilis]